MSKLVIVVDVDEVDPARVDPYEVAETILAEYDDARDAIGPELLPAVRFRSAEWSP